MVARKSKDLLVTIGNGAGREFVGLVGGASLVDAMKLKKPTGFKRVCFVSAPEKGSDEKPPVVGWKGESAHVRKSLSVAESADFLAAIAATGDEAAFVAWVESATAAVAAGGIVRIRFASEASNEVALVSAPAASVKRVASLFAAKAS